MLKVEPAWTPTLDSSQGRVRRFDGGYSLLEIVVVIAIVAVAMTLAAPSLIRMIERTEARNVLKSVDIQMTDLRVESFTRSVAFSSVEVQRYLSAELPDGWAIAVGDELHMTSRGYCSGGDITLTSPDDQSYGFTLPAGRCLIDEIVS